MAKIIIVEDDTFLLSVLADGLKKSGFEPEVAVNGEEGLDKIKKTKFDLILLDMILPKLDGFKVLEELKTNPDLAGIPVVVLSNLYDKNNIDKAVSLGAKEYIVKAYNTPEEIVNKIRVFLAKEGIK